MNNQKFICGAIFLILLLCFPNASLAITNYTITKVDFGTSYSQGVTGVNNAGQVVGWGANSSGYLTKAFLWENGNVTEIATGASPAYTTAAAINNSGEVVGTYNDHAFRWTKDGGMIDINPADVTRSSAVGINDIGDIVGGSYKTGDTRPNRKTLWKDGQVYVDTSASYPFFTSINNTGRIAGVEGSGSSGDCPLTFSSSPVWHYYDPCHPQDGGYWDWDMHELSSGGNASDARAYSINDDGEVVGVVFERAMFYSSSGEATDLGNLGGGATAESINNLGQIVGYSAKSWPAWNSGYYDAFLWEDDVMYNLNGLVLNGEDWLLEQAVDISDTGYIIGQGLLNNQEALFLLSPVPEPATLLLLGLGGLALLQKRKA